MPLLAGERLGPYEILGELGRGGMGMVYRARDTRLGRDVAIKVSDEQFSERFEREARVIASLNHPNICTLHDVGPDYLVMELIEGASPQGPLPLETVLDYARQMADALDYAHERGITHRDLKPGNLKITPDGKLKVLDFGLAKADAGSSIVLPLEGSPTLPIGATGVGVILGTAAYMAPEQARGKPVDKRADIWAFGVVLHELSTGQRPFQGEDASDTLASVLKSDPDLAPVPERLRPLLKRCLEKDPRKRVRDIADAMALVSESHPQPAPLHHRSWLWPAVATMLALGFGMALWRPWRVEPPVLPVTMFDLELPLGTPGPGAMSPNGRLLAIPIGYVNGRRLYVHDFETNQTAELSQVDLGGGVPFWSFDSRWLVYPSADQTIKKVDVRVGVPQTVCTGIQPPMMGGAWNAQGVVLTSVPALGVMRLTAAGCQPIAGIAGAFPMFLPDGRRFTYLRRQDQGLGMYVGALDSRGSPEAKPFAPHNPSGPLIGAGYVPSAGVGHGYILSIEEGDVLMARPFDEANEQVTGDAVPLAPGPVSGFEASATTLVYHPSALRQLRWIDRRTGAFLDTVGEPADIRAVALSPKNPDWAAEVERVNGTPVLFRIELSTGRKQKLTVNQSVVSHPVWSADGTEIAYSATGADGMSIYRRSADGAGEPHEVLKFSQPTLVTSWSSDGRYMLATRQATRTGQTIVLISLSGSGTKETPLLETESNGSQASFSPDNRWITYKSNESGTTDVIVRSFVAGTSTTPPRLGPPSTVSNRGTTGGFLGWLSDSRTLQYIGMDGAMEASMLDGTTGKFGAPRQFRSGGIAPGPASITPDGQRALVGLQAGTENARQNANQKLVVVLNYQSQLGSRNTASAK